MTKYDQIKREYDLGAYVLCNNFEVQPAILHGNSAEEPTQLTGIVLQFFPAHDTHPPPPPIVLLGDAIALREASMMFSQACQEALELKRSVLAGEVEVVE